MLFAHLDAEKRGEIEKTQQPKIEFLVPAFLVALNLFQEGQPPTESFLLMSIALYIAIMKIPQMVAENDHETGRRYGLILNLIKDSALILFMNRMAQAENNQLDTMAAALFSLIIPFISLGRYSNALQSLRDDSPATAQAGSK